MSDEEWTDRERWEGIARDLQGETVERIAAVLEQTAKLEAELEADKKLLASTLKGCREKYRELEAELDKSLAWGKQAVSNYVADCISSTDEMVASHAVDVVDHFMADGLKEKAVEWLRQVIGERVSEARTERDRLAVAGSELCQLVEDLRCVLGPYRGTNEIDESSPMWLQEEQKLRWRDIVKASDAYEALRAAGRGEADPPTPPAQPETDPSDTPMTPEIEAWVRSQRRTVEEDD